MLDLAKWDAALYTERILKRATLEQMWTPAKLNDGSDSGYGLGWGITNYHGHRLLSHTGSHMTGFKTALARFVDDKLTVIVFTNQREASQMAIARGVAGYYLPELQSKSKKEGRHACKPFQQKRSRRSNRGQFPNVENLPTRNRTDVPG